MNKHVALRPSSAAIWAGAGCTMHPHMAAKYGGAALDQTAAEEGTAAHWLAENLLLDPDREAFKRYLGAPAPNGVMVTEEMAEAVQVYTDHVKGLRGDLHIEQGVDVFKSCRGTPDLWVYDPQADTLHVIDYKHGFGIVDPFRNWQLSLYAAGILKAWTGLPPANVELTIIQPRAYSRDGTIRSWRAPGAELDSMWAQATVRAVEANSAPVARSSSGCRYCPARHACPAAIDAGVQLYEAATEALPYDLEASELGVQYEILTRAYEQLGFLVTAYEEQIKSALYRGGKVEGYGLEEKRGRAEWSVEPEEVQALGELYGVDLCPPTPLTPSKAINKGVDKGVISAYTQRHSKGHELVTVNLTNAKRIFA